MFLQSEFFTLKGFVKGPFPSEALTGGRGVEQGEEKVSSLRGWGDVPMRDFRTTSKGLVVSVMV